MKKNLERVTLSRESSRLSVVEDSDDAWKFSGYASVFGSVNDRGFCIQRGAYADLVANGAQPAMFFNHDSFSVPIGKWLSLEEDEYGLKVTGELSKNVRLAQDVHGALVDGLLNGMSVAIGWYSDDEHENPDGTVVLQKVADMPEISLVTFPADPKARIHEALSADEIDASISAISSIKDFESFVRDAAKLSRRQAKSLVASARAALAEERQRDAETAEEIAAINRLKKAISNF